MKFVPVSAILQAAALLLAIGSPGLSSHAQTSPKTFNYDVLTAGDCVLEQGTLSFSPTGEGRWRATIHTNHTTNRDIWHMSFNVLDSAGHQVFPVFIGDSPAMFGSPSPLIPWAVDFNFNANQFRGIYRITIRSSC